jgi:hypothetical protein
MLDGRAQELADWARRWYAAHGRPWVRAHQIETVESTAGTTRLDGVSFSSRRLHRMFDRAGAHAAVVAAVSAGPELEREARRLWDAERPDEYFFLEMYGSAVVEHLVTMIGARLCASAEEAHMAVLPHDSPGYTEWPISDQPRLLGLLVRLAGIGSAMSADGSIEVLESGMLRPKKSLLAVFGVTRHLDRVRHLADLQPCVHCAFARCQYRRAPYRREAEDARATDAKAARAPAQVPAARAEESHYSLNIKALRRWAAERLSLQRRDDGTIEAVFRYDGTTCTNSGRALEFRYEVTLESQAVGYVIRDERCEPAPGDTGHQSMCRFLSHREELMDAIAREHPLRGRPLDDVLTWPRPASPAGCYCDAEARDHKWGLVLETIHYALAHDTTVA